MTPFTLARLAYRIAVWAGPHVQRIVRKFNQNAREAERCFQSREYAEATRYYAGALKDAERRRYSPAKKIAILMRLAECLRRQDDAAGALPILEEAVSRAGKLSGGHALHAGTLDALGKLKEQLGDAAGVLETARESYAVSKRGNLPQFAQRCGHLAELERKAGNEQAARELLLESLALYEKSHGGDHPGTATQLATLAAVLQEEGNLTEALPMFEKALEVHKRTLGAHSPEYLRDLEHIGQIQYLQGNIAESLSIYASLARAKENVIGGSTAEHAHFLVDAATVHEAAGEPSKAMELLFQARQKAGRDAKLGSLVAERLARLSAG
jgi:tetratricopeptide (TPR) repeat protein